MDDKSGSGAAAPAPQGKLAKLMRRRNTVMKVNAVTGVAKGAGGLGKMRARRQLREAQARAAIDGDSVSAIDEDRLEEPVYKRPSAVMSESEDNAGEEVLSAAQIRMFNRTLQASASAEHFIHASQYLKATKDGDASDAGENKDADESVPLEPLPADSFIARVVRRVEGEWRVRDAHRRRPAAPVVRALEGSDDRIAPRPPPRPDPEDMRAADAAAAAGAAGSVHESLPLSKAERAHAPVAGGAADFGDAGDPASASASASASAASTAPSQAAPLPPGPPPPPPAPAEGTWEMRWAPDGTPYYFNETTEVSEWLLPEGAVLVNPPSVSGSAAESAAESLAESKRSALIGSVASAAQSSAAAESVALNELLGNTSHSVQRAASDAPAAGVSTASGAAGPAPSSAGPGARPVQAARDVAPVRAPLLNDDDDDDGTDVALPLPAPSPVEEGDLHELLSRKWQEANADVLGER